MMAELVRKPQSNGPQDNRSVPVAIPGSNRAHMEASSWRSTGGNSDGSSFRRNTPDKGTPPLDGWRRKTPVISASAHGFAGGVKRQEEKVDTQPGFAIHFNLATGGPFSEGGLVTPVLKTLQDKHIPVEHYFWIGPHSPPSNKELDNDSFGLGSFNANPALNDTGLRATVVIYTHTWGEADAGMALLNSVHYFDFPFTIVQLETARESKHSSLVLKNLPFQLNHEMLIEELTRMACRPSYIRYYHDDKGTFKGIAFVKYETQADAEKGRFQMDQLAMQGRKIRVEFKHKQGKSESRPDSHGRGMSLEVANSSYLSHTPMGESNRTPSMSPSVSPAIGPMAGGQMIDDNEEPDEEEKALDEKFKAFLASEEREFTLKKNAPGSQYVRKLCQRYLMRWDFGDDCTTIRKKPQTYTPRTTPNLRPLRALATPPSGPMGQYKKLPARTSDLVHHCKGPAETEGPGFPAGRGKPLPPAAGGTTSPQLSCVMKVKVKEVLDDDAAVGAGAPEKTGNGQAATGDVEQGSKKPAGGAPTAQIKAKHRDPAAEPAGKCKEEHPNGSAAVK
ncbi:hypothetical protein DIPPA_17115 [Diplonema papillatum]|nr:hypothetical protein DIPPA_17115 [Diplonema papillatum]